ncbi:MAG: SgcJ/EcaC family oxidoreductase [Segetibacter sp.]|jgi:uncharacterized protein (TIGR02246 family)
MRCFYLFIACLISVNSFCQKRSYDKRDYEALQLLPIQWVKFWNSHNIDSIARLLRTDVDVVTVGGTWLRNRDSFIKDHRDKFSTIFKSSVLSSDSVEIRYVKSDLAIIHFGWGITGDTDRNGNPQQLRHGIFTWVVSKQKKTWLILAAHNVLKPTITHNLP